MKFMVLAIINKKFPTLVCLFGSPLLLKYVEEFELKALLFLKAYKFIFEVQSFYFL